MRKHPDIRSLVRPSVRALRAYEAKEAPCRVKLDANESPYGFPLMKGVLTNRYPDPEAGGLRRALARASGVKPSNVLVGNGSDELIYYLVATFGGPVLYPTPTFVMYGIIARALGERPVEAPLDGSFDLDLGSTLKAIRKERPKLTFIASPNNPTGNCMAADRLLKVIESSSGIVVVDEAYQPFASERGFLPLLKDYRNLLVMRTLSKIGLAALRVGYLIGGEEALAEVNKVRLPFNVNSVSQALAVAALKDRAAMKKAIGLVVKERERLFGELSKMEGVEAYPSEANFILFRVRDSGRVHEGLLRRGVLVRNLGGIIEGCLRVTVGTRAEDDAFLRALRETLRK